MKLKPPIEPMEAKSAARPPVGDEWQYEPKWDGFRCLAFRDGGRVVLQSKSGQPLQRYFPDLVQALAELKSGRFVLDGEIVIAQSGRLSFDKLLLRIHPAASRIRKLATETPATLIAFDLLADDRHESLIGTPLRERRARLEKFFATNRLPNEEMRLSPVTTKLKVAMKWFGSQNRDLDGVIAKRQDLPYRAGERDGMVKVKHRDTVDCVVGGFRYLSKKKTVGSLLLGLYDSEGVLHHVGFTSGFEANEREEITTIVEPLKTTTSFTGRAPGRTSRWSTARSAPWTPVKPKLVVEVEYDHFTGGRFRHATNFIRWRPDKEPKKCSLDQVHGKPGASLKLLTAWK